MPLSEEKTDQRLIQISEQFRYLFNSNKLLGAAAICRGLGLISGTLRKDLTFANYGTLLHSNVPSFRENRYELLVNPVEQFVPITALCQKSCAISIMSISYNGKMGISITADKALFGRKVDLESQDSGYDYAII
ncbi:hypothetical protein Fcan01_16035 [Folsomia candida]|uniref:O-acyltransferase WSD1 C-terminal domain-containing protein n=1 Tax=Folsomia candida TaxID=158441 RepID=A0A226DXT5_FOLCA|nr:hypothetical protein Fcan01_16035 [Folsomia candida]